MKIHTYEKLWLALSFVLILLFIGTITYGATAIGITMVGDQGETLNPHELDQHPDFSDPGVQQVGENEYEAHIIASTFVFRPDPIEVPAGSTVHFHVTSSDVIHGFDLVGTNVNTMVIPGVVAEFTVEFEEPGTYGVVCNEYCGPGHHVMEGLLHVVPADEWEGDT